MKVNQIKAGAILSYVSMGLSSIISIFYTPVMLRLLGQSEYGLYSLANSVVSMLGILSGGFNSAYIRFYLKNKVRNDEKAMAETNGLFLIVFSIIGLIALICGGILVFNTQHMFGETLTPIELQKTRILMCLLVFNIAISFPFNIFNGHISANEKYIYQKLAIILKIILSPFIILPALLLGFKSIAMISITVALNIALELANMIFCFTKLKIKFRFTGFQKGIFIEILSFSIFIFINIIVDQINWNVDKFILGMLQGTVAVAIYGVAAQLNGYFMTISMVISSVFIPRVNKLVFSKDSNSELVMLMTKVGPLQFLLLMLIFTGILIFGREFITIWAGSDYTDSYLITVVLIAGSIIPYIQTIGVEIQKAKNMHRFGAILYVFIAVFNLMVSVILCKKYAGLGCAIGTAIGLVVGNGLIMNWYYSKKIKLDIKYFWTQILRLFPSVVFPCVIGMIVLHFISIQGIIGLCFGGVLYVIIYLISIWHLGMNGYEKGLVSGIGRKILRIR